MLALAEAIGLVHVTDWLCRKLGRWNVIHGIWVVGWGLYGALSLKSGLVGVAMACWLAAGIIAVSWVWRRGR